MTTITAVTSYEFSIFLHITAVMVGFGSTFALSVTFPVAMAMDPRHLPYVHRLGLTLSRFFATPALVIVLATGLYQVSKGDWDMGDLWLSGSLTILVVLGGIIGAYFIPTDRKLLTMVERDIAASGDGEVVLSEEYQRASRTEGIVGTITGVLLIVAVYLMVVKPGL
jgi:uncharacterized membrane protein